MTDGHNPQVQTQPQSILTQTDNPSLLKKFPGTKEKTKSKLFLVLGSFLVVIFGIATGWFLSGKKETSTTNSTGSVKTTTSKSDKEEGTLDESVKYDEAQGKLVEGGIKGEGTYHLERDNNPSRFVYLTSTAIGLDKFIGKDVKVWGETMSAINAPWLMDVVKIQVVE